VTEDGERLSWTNERSPYEDQLQRISYACE